MSEVSITRVADIFHAAYFYAVVHHGPEFA